jgi:hypothetical protein
LIYKCAGSPRRKQHDFDFNEIDVHFIPGIFSISEMQERICEELKTVGDIAIVLIDTLSAFFEGTDENDNRQAGDHARLLRGLTKLAGGLCAAVACHPPKNARPTNLQPRGLALSLLKWTATRAKRRRLFRIALARQIPRPRLRTDQFRIAPSHP